MSIFSRNKSKHTAPQDVNGKTNGQAQPAALNRNGQQDGKPNGPPVDPIVQRMAIQAASRKRMNSQTPDYSIKSASSSPVLPPADTASAAHPRARHGKKNSQDATLSKPTMTAGSDLAPIEVISPPKGNRLKKSSNSPQTLQAPFPKGADPDTQKVRMPAREPFQAAPQFSRDSGYASVAPSSTVDYSRTQSELTAPPDSELLRRHRQINASLTRGNNNENVSRTMTAAMTYPSQPPPPMTNDPKARTAPTTPTRPDAAEPNDALPYISRLDPGPASSSFLTTSVVPEISKPKANEFERRDSAPSRVPVGNNSPTKIAAENIRGSGGRAVDAPVRGSKEPVANKPTSNIGRPRESQPRSPRQEQYAQQVGSPSKERRTSDSHRTRRSESGRASLTTSPVQARSPIVQRTKDQEKAASRGVASSEDRRIGEAAVAPVAAAAAATAAVAAAATTAVTSQHQNTQPVSNSNTPFQTPEQTPSALPVNESQAGILDQTSVPSITLGNQRMSISGTDDPQLRSLQTDAPDSAPLPMPSPNPQEEFPYLAGISRGATLPPVSVLEGFKVNRRGQILDEEGDVIGELISGEIVHCVRRKINAHGEIIDDSGAVVGRAVALPPRQADDEEDNAAASAAAAAAVEAPKPNFSNEFVVSPISPATPMASMDWREITSIINKQPRQAQRAKSVPERTLNNSDSDGNVVYIELDASTDSQAVPLVDQSEIFIPPYGSTAAQSKSKSATNLAEIKRIADGRRSMQSAHTSNPSQEKISLEERRGSKWINRYYDSRTGQDMPSTNMNSERRTSAGKEQAERPRSFSLMTSSAPKAVLGPTWESLLDTVPDRSQSFSQHKSVIIDGGKLASQASFRSNGVTRSDTMPALMGSSGQAGGKNVGGAAAARARRTSQGTLNARNSTHQTFIKSPLSSIANTPPDTAAGSDNEFRRQLSANSPGRLQSSGSQNNIRQPADEDDYAAPAPIVKKKAVDSIKSGRKRKSFFGIPFGRSKQVAAN